jgi:hypothetical protein
MGIFIPHRIFNNLKDFFNNPREWKDLIKVYFRSRKLSDSVKEVILKKGIILSERILMEKNLAVPFHVELDYEVDEYIRTTATYESSSFEDGKIEIQIKSLLFVDNVDLIAHRILHEYSHAIFDASLYDAELLLAISQLHPHLKEFDLNYPILPDSIPEFDKYSKYKETFCEWFAYYLEDRVIITKNKEEIERLCNTIILRFRIVYEELVVPGFLKGLLEKIMNGP